MSIHLDHIVIAGPDLNELATRFETLTGIQPVGGGHHDIGTANALVPLASPSGSYIELIGPDPDADGLSEDVFGLASSTRSEPRVAAWAVRPDDLDAFAAKHGGGIEPLRRHTPDGAVLSWRLIPAQRGVDYVPFPFAIDWLDSTHPSTIVEPVAEVTRLIVHGATERVEVDEFEPEYRDGEPYLELVLHTPNGEVNLRDL
jgi:hypothetical protein